MEILLQSIFIYGITILLMYHCAARYIRRLKLCGSVGNCSNTLFWEYSLIPVLVFCLFAAMRYKVGVDCETYKKLYYEIAQFGRISSRVDSIEDGFIILSNLSSYVSGQHYVLFFLLAFLQIALLYGSLKSHPKALVFLGVAIFLSGFYWSLMNGIRQNIAACAFVVMVSAMITRRWWICVLMVLLGISMHKSALLMIPFAVLSLALKHGVLGVRKQIAILLVCVLLMNKISLSGAMHYASIAGYGDRAIEAYTKLNATDYTFGGRMFLSYGAYVITALYSKRMQDFYCSPIYNIVYNFFFVSICMQLVFYNDFTVNRIIYYTMVFVPIALSYLMYYFYSRKRAVQFMILILLLLGRTTYDFYVSYLSLNKNEYILYKFDV